MPEPTTEARELVAELKRLGLVTETKTGEYRLRSKGRAVRDFLNAMDGVRVVTLLTPAETAAKSKRPPVTWSCFHCGASLVDPDTFVGDPDGESRPVCDMECAVLAAVPR